MSGTARRFFVPVVSLERANDHEYFHNIKAQLEDGGYEALLFHLLHEIDIRDFNVRAVPKTAALAEQIMHSRKGVDLLVEKACNEAIVPCQGWPGFSICTDTDKQRGFDHFVDHHGDRELVRIGALGIKRELHKKWGCITGSATRKQIAGSRVYGISWPDLADLRASFEARFGAQEWLNPAAQQWQEAKG